MLLLGLQALAGYGEHWYSSMEHGVKYGLGSQETANSNPFMSFFSFVSTAQLSPSGISNTVLGGISAVPAILSTASAGINGGLSDVSGAIDNDQPTISIGLPIVSGNISAGLPHVSGDSSVGLSNVSGGSSADLPIVSGGSIDLPSLSGVIPGVVPTVSATTSILSATLPSISSIPTVSTTFPTVSSSISTVSSASGSSAQTSAPTTTDITLGVASPSAGTNGSQFTSEELFSSWSGCMASLLSQAIPRTSLGAGP